MKSGLTAEGRIMHERVHEQDRESRGNVRIEYGLPLRSLRLGLIGKADVVEFHRIDKGHLAAFSGGVQAGKAKARPLRLDPALRPGHVSGRDAVRFRSRWGHLLWPDPAAS